ncbi:MAG: hypothetical protein ACREDY_03200, partial [Bradyrhizobium sp.]
HDGAAEGRSFGQAVASSAVLHGLAVLFVLFLASAPGVQGAHGTLELVPVEIEVLGDSPGAQPAAPIEPVPTTTSTDANQASDQIETKLQALAKLRQSDTDQASLQPGPPASTTLMSDDAAPGRMAALRDFIRDQVERHWSLDLASLGDHEFSIPIRVQIADSGTVLEAEIIDTARASDPVYQEIASSARNAVLSASPLSLPAGHYQTVTELVLYLNPRATLR